jgi:hypothetical protein
MSDFSRFLELVKTGAITLGKDTVSGFAKRAETDTADFLRRSREDLIRWTGQLARQDLSKEEFESLVRGQADLAKMAALTQAGAALADIQRFRDGLINLVVSSATKVFLPGV